MSVSPTNQDLSNDTTFSQIKSRVSVPLKRNFVKNNNVNCKKWTWVLFYTFHANFCKNVPPLSLGLCLHFFTILSRKLGHLGRAEGLAGVKRLYRRGLQLLISLIHSWGFWALLHSMLQKSIHLSEGDFQRLNGHDIREGESCQLLPFQQLTPTMNQRSEHIL